MVGIGPEWVHMSQSGIKTNAIGPEFALDFMSLESARNLLCKRGLNSENVKVRKELCKF